jgi:hypothetical protein
LFEIYQKMAYNKYTTQEVIETFNLTTKDWTNVFDGISPVQPSSILSEYLNAHLDLAVAIGTEKSRSEFVVAPVLGEVYRTAKERISLFSGTYFNVDSKRKLTGICDFLISKNPEKLAIKSPVVAIVEAKRENIEEAIGQCAAEMIAAQIFNEQRKNAIPTIYGVTTSGENWKFLKLIDTTLYVQPLSTHIEKLPMILGWFAKAVA